MQEMWTSWEVALPIAAAIALLLMGLLLTLELDRRRRQRLVMRERLECPVHGRQAVVDFVFEQDNGQVFRDVARCSLGEPGKPVSCGKVCRSSGVAPFGRPVRVFQE
jgi:hypothetical protein